MCAKTQLTPLLLNLKGTFDLLGKKDSIEDLTILSILINQTQIFTKLHTPGFTAEEHRQQMCSTENA